MKALSVWQHWANAMAQGQKKNETRGWYLSYRGDLVICSAKKIPTVEDLGGNVQLHNLIRTIPPDRFGKALCVVEVYDCVPTKNFIRNAVAALLPLRTITEMEWSLGNYAPGRFAIMTKNLRVLKTPVPVRGRQSLFDLSPEEEKAVRAQLYDSGTGVGCEHTLKKDAVLGGEYCTKCLTNFKR